MKNQEADTMKNQQDGTMKNQQDGTVRDLGSAGMKGQEGNTMQDIALRIACSAHTGQTDKSGHEYIDHPLRVAARVGDNSSAIAAALLHDVLEDSDVTAEELRANGISDEVIEAVIALTRTPGVSDADYYCNIRNNPLALTVKLADISDNLDETRLAQLPQETQQRLRKKYAASLAQLKPAEAGVNGGVSPSFDPHNPVVQSAD